jgi:hypothetical protein
LLTSRDNFSDWCGTSSRIGCHSTCTRRRRGSREIGTVFGADFHGCGPCFSVDAARWRAAYAALGYRLPANAELWETGIAHVPLAAGSTGKAYHFREMLPRSRWSKKWSSWSDCRDRISTIPPPIEG